MTMKWERYAAATGIGFVVLYVVAGLVQGDPAAYGDSGSQMVQWLADNRRDILLGTIIQGAAAIAFVWYIAALAARIRAAGEARLGATVFGAGLLVAALAGVATTLVAGTAYGIEQTTDAAIVNALYDLGFVATNLTAWPAAAMALAVGIAALRSNVFPQWFGLASLAGAGWFTLSGFAWAREGFFAVDGGAGFISLIVFLAWSLVTSGLLVRDAMAEETAPRPAMASM